MKITDDMTSEEILEAIAWETSDYQDRYVNLVYEHWQWLKDAHAKLYEAERRELAQMCEHNSDALMDYSTPVPKTILGRLWHGIRRRSSALRHREP